MMCDFSLAAILKDCRRPVRKTLRTGITVISFRR